MCFSEFDADLRSTLTPELLRKIHCAARDGLNMNTFPVPDLPEVDRYFPLGNQSDVASIHDLVCDDFNFNSRSTQDVIGSVLGEMQMLKDHFMSDEISQAYQNSLACVVSDMNKTEAGQMFGNAYLRKRVEFMLFFFRMEGIY